MMILDPTSVQEIVFGDAILRRQLPDLKHHFDAWLLGVRVPAMRQTAKRAVLDLLNDLNEGHLSVISEHIGGEVGVERLDYHIVKEVKMCPENLENTLNQTDGYVNFVVTRGLEDVTVTFWR